MMSDDFVQPRTWEPDPVIEVYKKDVDRTLLREHLKLTPSERVELMVQLLEFTESLRQGIKKATANAD